jgi:hypothetical protein
MPTGGNEAEWLTRKKRIDTRLRTLNPQWQIIPWHAGLDTSKLNCHAVTEFPTDNGPADYALFVDGIFIGIIEAKKVTVNPQNVLEQAKRYSPGAANGPGNWNGRATGNRAASGVPVRAGRPVGAATDAVAPAGGPIDAVPPCPRLRRPTRPPKSRRRTGRKLLERINAQAK